MIGKLGFLLFFLPLCFALPNKTLEVATEPHQEEIAVLKVIDSKFNYQIGNKVYYVESKVTVNWHQAAHNCRQMGGNLLNIETCGEMDALLTILPHIYWISGNCLSGNRKFLSIASGVAMPYNRWLPGEPNNLGGNENCVHIKTGAFNDDECSKPYSYVCEAKLIN